MPIRKVLSMALLFFAALLAFAEDRNAEIKAAVADGYKQWVAAANRKDADALTNLYDENAVLLPPHEEAAIGKAAIRAWYAKFVSDPE